MIAPRPMIAPPAQSHETRGITSTRIVAQAFARVSYAARIV